MRVLTGAILAALLLAVGVLAGCGGTAILRSAELHGDGLCRTVVDRELADAGEGLRAAQPRDPGQAQLGHSPCQVTALAQGAPADVLATASTESMQDAVRRGLLATPPKLFARNRLRIVVPAG